MAQFASNFTNDSIVIVPLETLKTYTAHRSNANFDLIKAALANPDTTTDEMVSLLSPAAAIKVATADYKNIEVIAGVLMYQGEEVHSALAERILSIVREGLPITAWARFAENLFRNPAEYARDELYLWLETSNLPITPDGHFLAYKRVREDYTDVHSGTFDNSIGCVPSMPREDVDSDRSRTCSAGLHFCSESYLKSFSGARVMIVKVNPEHVVSIPSDYGNAKGRACQYEVIGEVTEDEIATVEWPAVTTDYGQAYPAVVADEVPVTKPKSRTFYIETKELGRLNVEHLKNGIAKHGSASAWAKSLGVGKSTVKGWRLKFRALGADV